MGAAGVCEMRTSAAVSRRQQGVLSTDHLQRNLDEAALCGKKALRSNQKTHGTIESACVPLSRSRNIGEEGNAPANDLGQLESSF